LDAAAALLYVGWSMPSWRAWISGAKFPAVWAYTPALRWHLVLWDPWWLGGGVLLGIAAWGYQRRSRRGV
jgi:hypothetical protein